MNYLAHFHLAGKKQGHIVGALLGDFVKGPMTGITLPDDIKQGILLHRRIDSFTDQHPAILSLGRTLPCDVHRFKSILTDLFFDYALAKHWDSFCDEHIEHYEQRVHATLDLHRDHYDSRALQMVDRLQRHQLLANYSEREVLDGIIVNIGKRLRRSDQMQAGAEAMWKMKEEWEAAFLGIYPQLQQFAEMEISKFETTD